MEIFAEIINTLVRAAIIASAIGVGIFTGKKIKENKKDK